MLMNWEAVKAALVFMLVGLVLGGIIGYGVFGRSKATDYVSERDTSTYIDTIPYYQPVPKDSMVIKYVTRTLPVKRRDSSTTNKTDTFLAENYAQNNGENIPPLYASVDSDSAAVAIPITQKRYDAPTSAVMSRTLTASLCFRKPPSFMSAVTSLLINGTSVSREATGTDLRVNRLSHTSASASHTV